MASISGATANPRNASFVSTIAKASRVPSRRPSRSPSHARTGRWIRHPREAQDSRGRATSRAYRAGAVRRRERTGCRSIDRHGRRYRAPPRAVIRRRRSVVGELRHLHQVLRPSFAAATAAINAAAGSAATHRVQREPREREGRENTVEERERGLGPERRRAEGRRRAYWRPRGRRRDRGRSRGTRSRRRSPLAGRGRGRGSNHRQHDRQRDEGGPREP